MVLTKIDLHIHSSLSACAEDIMSPQSILKQAEKKSIGLIAITDHNAIDHSLLMHKLSKKSKTDALLGVEITSKEEIHLLGYFPDEKSIKEMGKIIEEYLPTVENRPDFFGYQLLYDEKEQVIQIDHRLRQNALQMGLDDLVKTIHFLGGIAVPAHVKRAHCSIISQIGFLDSASEFDAVEVSRFEWMKKKYTVGALLSGYPVISGSDSHFISEIGTFFIETEDKNRVMDFDSFKNILRKIRFEKYC